MTRELRPYESAIAKAQDEFTKTAEGLAWEREKIFAVQALMKSEHAMQVANKNPLSVRIAMLNVAATGLTLNPASKYAFLVPRDGAIVLDISYIGLLKIATDTGSIVWGRAECVHEGDTFKYRGPAKEPEHDAEPFRKDRGEIVGVYCIAKTAEGDILTDYIDRDGLETIRAASDLWARKKSGPWLSYFGEMCKKAVIKRAQKTWPKTDKSERLAQAIELANQSEGGYMLEAQPLDTLTDDQSSTLARMLAVSGVDASQYLSLFGVEAIEAIPRFRYAEAAAYLRGGMLRADH